MARRLVVGILAVVAAASSAAASGFVTTAQASTGTSVAIRATSLGLVLTSSSGRTLYVSTHDSRNRSRCTGTCARTWLPLLTRGTPHASGGAFGRLLCSIARGGTRQVTYAGHPLYRYAGDHAAGQTRGQGRVAFGGTWWVLAPDGTAGMGTTISVHTTSIGPALAGMGGRTVYEFDSDPAGVSRCSGACATAWPPVLTTGAPHAAGGAVASKLGTTVRSGGVRQVTYNHRPLYYYLGDSRAAQTNGEGLLAFGSYWYVLRTDGSKNTDSQCPPAAGVALATRAAARSGRFSRMPLAAASTCSMRRPRPNPPATPAARPRGRRC